MPDRLRNYHRYQRFPIYPVGRGGAERRRRPAPAPPTGPASRLGRLIVRLLGGDTGRGRPGGSRGAGSMAP